MQPGITTSLKLFPTAIYPQQTNIQGIAAENHIKIVSCVDIFLTVFGQRRQCCLLLPKMRVITVGNIHTPRRDDDVGLSQTPGPGRGRRNGLCAHAIVVGPVAAEVTAKLACLAAHEMLREYVRYPHIIMHVT